MLIRALLYSLPYNLSGSSCCIWSNIYIAIACSRLGRAGLAYSIPRDSTSSLYYYCTLLISILVYKLVSFPIFAILSQASLSILRKLMPQRLILYTSIAYLNSRYPSQILTCSSYRSFQYYCVGLQLIFSYYACALSFK